MELEEAKKSYEILFEKIMFVDKYRMLKPHWIKFHNYIKKLEKEIEEYKLLNANIEKANRIIEGKEEYIPKDKIRELIKKDSEIDKVEFEDDDDLNYERKIIDVDYIEELLEED